MVRHTKFGCSEVEQEAEAGGVSGQLRLHNEALTERKRGRYKVQYTRRQKYQLNGRNINKNNERGTLLRLHIIQTLNKQNR